MPEPESSKLISSLCSYFDQAYSTIFDSLTALNHLCKLFFPWWQGTWLPYSQKVSVFHFLNYIYFNCLLGYLRLILSGCSLGLLQNPKSPVLATVLETNTVKICCFKDELQADRLIAVEQPFVRAVDCAFKSQATFKNEFQMLRYCACHKSKTTSNLNSKDLQTLAFFQKS